MCERKGQKAREGGEDKEMKQPLGPFSLGPLGKADTGTCSVERPCFPSEKDENVESFGFTALC